MFEDLKLMAVQVGGSTFRKAFSTSVVLCILLLGVTPRAPAFTQEAQQSRYSSVPPKAGERCIICNVPLGEDDTVLIVRGRRVPLKNAMVDSFMNNQEQYFSELQPKSALFQENLATPPGVAQAGVGMGWFLFGVYVLVAFICAGVCGYVAVSKGLPAIPNFFIGLSFSVFGVLYVLTRKSLAEKEEVPPGLVKVPVTKAPLACPVCGEKNHPTAKGCAHCGAKLEPRYDSEVSKT